MSTQREHIEGLHVLLNLEMNHTLAKNATNTITLLSGLKQSWTGFQDAVTKSWH